MKCVSWYLAAIAARRTRSMVWTDLEPIALLHEMVLAAAADPKT